MTEKQETSAHLDAQLGVIGSLLLDADKCAGEVFLRTREEQYTGEYKTLFAAAKRLYQEGRPIDPVTVRGIAGEEYTNLILQIMELTPTAANCGAYLDLLVEQAQVSKMQTLGLALASCKSAEEAKHLIEEANQVVVQRAALRVVSAEQGHLEFLLRQDEKVSYIPWGFPKLDETVLSTLGDLVILGGRPSAGKTALSLQMAWEQAKTQKVGYFSFETNPDEVYDRLHALAVSVDSVKIRKRTLDQDEIARVLSLIHISDGHKAPYVSPVGPVVLFKPDAVDAGPFTGFNRNLPGALVGAVVLHFCCHAAPPLRCHIMALIYASSIVYYYGTVKTFFRRSNYVF